MLSDPRSIAFIVECINPQARHDPEVIRKLYARTLGVSGLDYKNCNVVPGGVQMTTNHGPSSIPGSTRQSMLGFAPDRIQIKEEWPDITVDEFLEKVAKVMELASEELGVTVYPVTQCVVRALVSVQGLTDSREFFNRHFFRVDDDALRRLGRNLNLFGLRLAFPAAQDDPSVHNVRIESFNGDVRSVFIEDAGVYPRPFTTSDVGPLEEAFRSSYDFLTGNVVDYLRGLESEPL